MAHTKKAVRLGGAEITAGCHACAFFHTAAEEYEALLPFAKEGFDRGEKTFHIVDPKNRPERLRRLKEVGVTEEGAQRPGQLEVRVWQNAYLREGCFDQDAMLALVDETLGGAKRDGFGLTRFWADMEWALEELPGVNYLVEYETRLNYLLPKYDDVVVCTYDLARFSARVVMDILRTHPTVLIGGLLQENPFYVPPDQFLEELKQREQPSCDRDLANV